MKREPAIKAQPVRPRLEFGPKWATAIDIGADAKAFALQQRQRINQVFEAFFCDEAADGQDALRFNVRPVRAEALQVGAVIDDLGPRRHEAGEMRRIKARAGNEKPGGAGPDAQVAWQRGVKVLGMRRHAEWGTARQECEVGHGGRAVDEVGVYVADAVLA